VDVRTIRRTHRDLDAPWPASSADLYQQCLNVVTLTLPPLVMALKTSRCWPITSFNKLAGNMKSA
jgi:transcriptional regulator of acetoin/glycerol metabolism